DPRAHPREGRAHVSPARREGTSLAEEPASGKGPLTFSPTSSPPFSQRVRQALLRNLLRVPLRLLDQLFQGCVDGLLAGAAHPLVADHALGVDDVVGRRGGVPFFADGAPVG